MCEKSRNIYIVFFAPEFRVVIYLFFNEKNIIIHAQGTQCVPLICVFAWQVPPSLAL